MGYNLNNHGLLVVFLKIVVFLLKIGILLSGTFYKENLKGSGDVLRTSGQGSILCSFMFLITLFLLIGSSFPV